MAAKKKSAKTAAKPAKKAAVKSKPAKKAKAAKKAKPAKKAKAAKKAAKPAKKAAKPAKKAKAAKSSKAAKPAKKKSAAVAKKASKAKAAKPAAPKSAKRENKTPQAPQPRSAPRRTRDTTLPPDHELLDQGPLKGDPVQKELVIEAVRAALHAVEQHPMKGSSVLDRRNLVELPKEGEIDFAIAQEAQKSARELLDADAAVASERREVDERIAQVYASEAQGSAEDDEDE